MSENDARHLEKKYSISEAGALLGLSRVSVWREIRRKNLGSYQLLNRRLIGESHLRRYLEERELKVASRAEAKAA